MVAITNGAVQASRSSIEHRLVARRLLRALETGRQRQRIFQQRYQAEVFGCGREGRLDARGGAARERSLHGADAALDATDRRAELDFAVP